MTRRVQRLANDQAAAAAPALVAQNTATVFHPRRGLSRYWSDLGRRRVRNLRGRVRRIGNGGDFEGE